MYYNAIIIKLFSSYYTCTKRNKIGCASHILDRASDLNSSLALKLSVVLTESYIILCTDILYAEPFIFFSL